MSLKKKNKWKAKLKKNDINLQIEKQYLKYKI